MLAIVLLLLGISFYISTRISKPTVPQPPPPTPNKPPTTAIPPPKAQDAPDATPVKYQPREYKIGVSDQVDCCSGNTCLPYTNGLRLTEEEMECDMLQFFEHI